MPQLKLTNKDAATKGIELNGFDVAEVRETGLTFLQPIKVPGGIVSPVGMFKNKLINGDFQVWQRRNSNVAAVQAGVFTADRWLSFSSGTQMGIAQTTHTPGEPGVEGAPIYFTKLTINSVAGAANYAQYIQRIEYVRSVSGKKYTISFYAKSSVPKTISTHVSQVFGSGGSATVPYIGITKHNLTTSWQKYTATIDVPSVVGKTINDSLSYLQLEFWLDAGTNWVANGVDIGQSSAVIDISRVQFEEGETATIFEERQMGLEVHLCYRYFRLSQLGIIGNGYAVGGFVGVGYDHPAFFRSVPTATPRTPNENVNLSALQFSLNQYGCRIWGGTIAAGNAYYSGIVEFNSEI